MVGTLTVMKTCNLIPSAKHDQRQPWSEQLDRCEIDCHWKAQCLSISHHRLRKALTRNLRSALSRFGDSYC
jgi:hypothetical protein